MLVEHSDDSTTKNVVQETLFYILQFYPLQILKAAVLMVYLPTNQTERHEGN